MFERLLQRGTALARKAALDRRSGLEEALREEAPVGVEVSAEEEGVALSGRGLRRRLALEPELRWLLSGQARDLRGRRR